ncbi:MAG TPA: hypothetical protein VLI90_07120, partial [Tepidisphaeraceae bacterium]|nr:hypothetical protein [Tepidisphaeraceae bacterium]
MSLTFDSKLSAARASAIEALERRVLLSTYYVSPSGSDTNPGTLAAPWQTIAKVNDTVFSPGDQILLARGGQWRESLNASADGAPGAPIVYGNYGDANLPKPLLIGSDILLTSRFTLLSGTTYTLQSTTPINWIYDNHAFTHNSEVFLRTSGSGDPSAEADNVNYVEQNAESFYYDASSATLYLNVGSSPAAHLITAAVREDAVYNNRHSNIHFVGLAATETAHDGGGYAFRSQLGDNIQIIDCDASLAGKHEFGAIDSNNFLGENLTAQLAAPDLGYGGSSAYVSYSDSVNGRANDSAQWINLTWSNPGGAYPIFISHGDPGAIGSLFLQNLVSLGGYGTGIIIYSTGPQERIVLLGGHLDGGTIQLDPDYSVVDGLTLTGDGADLFLGGSNDVVQNSRLIGLAPNPFIGRNGGIIDGGFNNTIRFNTFHWNDEPGPGVSITHNNSNTHIYANLFDVNQPIRLLYNTGGSLLDSDYNLFGTSYDTAPVFGVGDVNTPGKYTLAQWHANGYDLDSVVGDPKFNDAADGDLTLQSTSPALDLYTQTPDATPTSANHDLKGDTRPLGPAYDAGAFEAPGPPLVLNGTTGPDAFYIRVDAANPAAVDVWQNTGHDGSGLPTFISPFDAFYSIIVNGGGGGDGGDLLTLDFSNGPFGAPGITYNAGDGSGSGAGGNDAGGAIVAGGADSISVIGTTGSDNITVDSAQVQVNSITITLAQPTVVNVDGKGGSDTLTA